MPLLTEQLPARQSRAALLFDSKAAALTDVWPAPNHAGQILQRQHRKQRSTQQTGRRARAGEGLRDLKPPPARGDRLVSLLANLGGQVSARLDRAGLAQQRAVPLAAPGAHREVSMRSLGQPADQAADCGRPHDDRGSLIAWLIFSRYLAEGRKICVQHANRLFKVVVGAPRRQCNALRHSLAIELDMMPRILSLAVARICCIDPVAQ